MKIDKLEICNFKNYQNLVTFDLQKKITIIHGENGYGKSSFFDAIEWCLTHSIERFDGDNSDIKKDIINKQCKEKEFPVFVKISFSGKTLERSFKVTNGEVGNTLTRLTLEDGKEITGKDNVEAYLKEKSLNTEEFSTRNASVSIKKTNILSQDQISDFVTSENAANRYRALVNIMGLKPLLNETDNYKEILKGLIKEKEKNSNEIDKLNTSIISKKETTLPIQKEVLEEKIKMLKIEKKLDKIDKSTITKLKKNLTLEMNKNENFFEFFSILKDYKNETIDSIIKKKDNLEEKFETNLNKASKRNKLLASLLRQKEIILVNEERQENINTLKDEINSYEKYLKENKVNISQKALELKLKTDRQIADKYEYLISIYDTYYSNEKTIKSLTKENEIILESETKLFAQKQKYTQLVPKLEKKSKDYEGEIIVKLLNNVKQIDKYVRKNSLEKCPVCSSIPKKNLQKSIEENISVLSNHINEDTKKLERILTIIDKVQNKVNKIDRLIKNDNHKYSRNQDTITRVFEENNKYESDSLYEKSKMAFEKEVLILNVQKKREDIEKTQKGLINLISLASKKKEIEDFLKIDNYDGNSLVNAINHKDLKKYSARISFLEEEVSKRINDAEQKMRTIEAEKKELQKIVTLGKNVLKEESYFERFSSINENLLKETQSLETKILIVDEITEFIRVTEINKEIERQIDEIKNRHIEKSKKAEKLNGITRLLTSYVEARFMAFGTETKDFFNKDVSPIQKYFRYLNPIPSNSKLVFEGKKEEINIKISLEKLETINNYQRNAKNFLSSGQLNVLAISIFLAINEKQKTNFIDFLAIDDPIQNMDDVNQYSICDVLGNLDKQLIFSTHDLDFLKLFINKNLYRKHDIQVFNFLSPYLKEDKVRRISF